MFCLKNINYEDNMNNDTGFNENTCGSCSHWHFTLAHDGIYIGWCKVRRQHIQILNAKEKACFDYKRQPIKQQSNSSNRSTPYCTTIRFDELPRRDVLLSECSL